MIYVLEDNLCVFFGVFYMLENCLVLKCVFLDMFEKMDIFFVNDYFLQLFDMLLSLLLCFQDKFEVVVFIFGIYNFVYFEYCYFVQEMGCELVEG